MLPAPQAGYLNEYFDGSSSVLGWHELPPQYNYTSHLVRTDHARFLELWSAHEHAHEDAHGDEDAHGAQHAHGAAAEGTRDAGPAAAEPGLSVL